MREKIFLTIVGIIWPALLLGGTAFGQDRRPDRGFKSANSYSISDIENVNLTNGNLVLTIPLASLPAGRGTSPGYTVSASYNSKVWDRTQERRFDGSGEGIGGTIYMRELVQPGDQGGWAIDDGLYRLKLVNRLDLEKEALCGDGSQAYQRNGYVNKLEVQFPNGSAKEFRPSIGSEFYAQADGFFDVNPWGQTHIYQWTENEGHYTCNDYITQTTTSGITYYTNDGSFVRLYIPHYSTSVSLSSMSWTMYMPDGTIVENLPTDDASILQRQTDRNGNKLVWKYATLNSISGLEIQDDVGHYIFIDRDKIIQPGVNGEPIETDLHWTDSWVYRHYKATTAGNGNTSYIYADEFCALEVLDRITLPEQAGGREYTFTYNGSSSQPSTGNYTNGWGELKSITLPSGATAAYSYALDGSNDSEQQGADVLANVVTERDLTYDRVYDGVTSSITETTGYGITSASGTGDVANPDGGTHQENSLWTGDQKGYAYRISQPNNTIIEKIWAANAGPGVGFSQNQTANAYVKTEFTTVRDASGSPSQTAIKDYDYDYNGNVLEVREYDWVPYSSVPRTSTGPSSETLFFAKPTGLPTSGLTLKRKTVNTYYNPTTNSSNVYTNPSSPRLHNIIKSTEIQDGSGNAKARTEFYYDDPSNTGNLTETRVWDNNKGSLATPDSNGSKLNSGNSISTYTTYNSYGALTQTADSNGVQTTITYGCIDGNTSCASSLSNLYPTKTEVASNYSTLKRTSTIIYDFYTGLVTTATDADNSVSTVTTYDDLGRPIKVATAAGTSLESWVQTTYHDGDSNDSRRYIIVKSDIETKSDGRKVAATFYDQLGRVRLSKTLEDTSIQSATNETDGIKVQTRYLTDYNTSTLVGHTYQLTSNPYRASTSSGASSEPTMGWTLSTALNNGRHSEVQTFSGSGLPAPWGSNSSSTGIVQTDIDANSTTITDQAGKLRRSITNGLGQLIRVDEPNSSNQLGTVSSPNQDTGYAYDVLDNLTTVTQGSQSRTFTYSSLSRLLTAANPESGTISYAYDSNGNLTRRTDARGVQTDFVYDALNRVTNRNYSTPGGTPSNYQASLNTTYTYGAIAPAVGILTKVSTGTGSGSSTTEYTSFDLLGRITASKQTTDGGDTNGYTMGYTYRLNGALDEETYPSTRKVKSVLASNGDLAVVESKKNSSSGYWHYADSFTYNQAGEVTSVQLGNGRWESTVFNTRLQPTEIALGTIQSGTDRLKLEFGYGTTANNGNILSQTITVPTLSNPFIQAYTYDSLNRLQSATETYNGSQTWKQEFSLDRYGNRNFVTGTGHTDTLGSCTTMCNPTFSGTNNRITSSGYGYDSSGSITGDPSGKTFVYDGENKQVEVRDGSNNAVGDYFYDGEGKRVKKYVPGTGEITVFVYDAAGKGIAEYSTIIASSTTAKVGYLTSDHLSSPRINTDASGTVIARHDYMPFGEEIATSQRTSSLGYQADTMRKQFTGYERDNETNLDFAEARNYAYNTGRFLTTDPSRKSALASNPQTWNRYIYCFDNPLSLVDRNGKWPTATHNSLIRTSFKGLSAADISHIQRGSYMVDCCGSAWKPVSTLWPSEAYKHAMTPEGMTPVQAREKAAAYLKEMGQLARKTQREYEEAGGKGLSPMALDAFGRMTHVYEDMTSPAHGFDKIYGIPMKPTEQSGYLTAKAGEVPLKTTEPDLAKFKQEMDEHEAMEARDPTPEERAQTELYSRTAFLIVFGKKAFNKLDLTESERKAALDFANKLNPNGLQE